jgi:hypothetical protein
MSTISPNPLLISDEYRKVRTAQISNAIAVQFDRLTDIARGVEPRALQRFDQSPVLPILPDRIVSATPPYTGGSPDPVQGFNSVTGQAQSSGSGVTAFALGKKNVGRISLGASGGIDRLYGGFTPLTGTWLLGDSTTISASLSQSQTIDDSAWPRQAMELVCQIELANPALLAQLPQTGAVTCSPGKADSALGGFVGVSGAFDVTAALFSPEGALLATETTSRIFLEFAINAQKPGTFDDRIDDPSVFVALDWLFDSAPARTIQQSVTLPLQAATTRRISRPTVVVEATVRLVGARGGVKDPGGGLFYFAFADPSDHVPFFGTSLPFTVPRMVIIPGFWPSQVR